MYYAISRRSSMSEKTWFIISWKVEGALVRPKGIT